MTRSRQILSVLFSTSLLAGPGMAGRMLASPADAQEDFRPEELLQQAAEWARDNIDPSVFEALGLDQDRARQFLAEVQKQFQGTYVYDLGALRETANRLQPILLKFEETQPYGVWLQAHLDYFDVSETLRREVVAVDPGRLPAPSPQVHRTAWVKVLEARPVTPSTTQQVLRLKRIFAEERVPPALVWVAEVESSFDPRARSPAGAAGLFQLMPVTARSLGLSVTLPDERLHAEKSARAAARYLRHLYGRFGDWRLALAAYNGGETRVETLRKGSTAGTFDAIAHRLPVETQMFVPKVEATLRRREGIRLQELGPPKA